MVKVKIKQVFVAAILTLTFVAALLTLDLVAAVLSLQLIICTLFPRLCSRSRAVFQRTREFHLSRVKLMKCSVRNHC